MRTLGLYPVCRLSVEIHEPGVDCRLTSPTARYFPSGLKETQVAALTRSRAVHDCPAPGESLHAVAGEPSEDTPMPDSLNVDALRMRLSAVAGVGVEGPYADVEELTAAAVGRARKNRCETWYSSSTVAMTAAAPAVKAKQLPLGSPSKELAEAAVVPMTWRSARAESLRLGLTGDFAEAPLGNGELEGVSLRAKAGLISLALETGVTDISSHSKEDER